MNEAFFVKNFPELKKRTHIMGILNVTPDSFSDGGKFNQKAIALSHTEKMIADGADIIDIGAVSTRPFADSVSEEEEWSRLKDILREIKMNFSVPVSVDTFSPLTAQRCLDAGADIINDVSGVFSPLMADVIKKYNCGWVIMHGGVLVRKAEEEIQFPDGIIYDVNAFFDSMIAKIVRHSIPLGNICLDPGFGFSKNTAQNIELLENLEKINKHSLVLLCALSRKRFIGEISGESEPEKRDTATHNANIIAVKKGADIVRVHNVRLSSELRNI